jgi:hypothetical protein
MIFGLSVLSGVSRERFSVAIGVDFLRRLRAKLKKGLRVLILDDFEALDGKSHQVADQSAPF